MTKRRVICDGNMYFYVDAETFEPLSNSQYDPWLYQPRYAEAGDMDYVEWLETRNIRSSLYE